MPVKFQLPIVYPITSGESTPDQILQLVRAAVDAEVPLFQIREKLLSGRVLFDVVARAAELTRGSKTHLLVNDRSDIARAAGADGVHLTTHSLPVEVVRKIYGAEFLIGVSTHSLDEARAARAAGADFIVFGPVFETESKRVYGPPQGLDKLSEVTPELGEFPVVAIGGITLENVGECFRAGASGVAAIRLLSDAHQLLDRIHKIRSKFSR
jgi:thiamine-phosphate pyrophosphorylase